MSRGFHATKVYYQPETNNCHLILSIAPDTIFATKVSYFKHYSAIKLTHKIWLKPQNFTK